MSLLLTVTEAAGELRISRARFYELLREGRIRSIHIGSLRRVPADALTEYVAALEADAAVSA